MSKHHCWTLLAVLAGLTGPGWGAQDGPAAARGVSGAAGFDQEGQEPAEARLEWTARQAEHLFNRAGFGARGADIDRAVKRGMRATVDGLLRGYGETEPFFLDAPYRPSREEKKDLTEDERRELRNRIAREDRELMNRFADWWIDQMIRGEHPLREHMTLFWHGHFTSSYREVKNGEAMVRQNELFREHALGSFETLLREVLRDPAMMLYLDNNRNTRKKPNENLARELPELFTLGVGNYSEEDIKEAARALTGGVVEYPEGAVFNERRHDRGKKSVLGATGRHDLDGLVDVILKRKACSRWVAGRLLEYFEGRPPEPERLERYAGLLRRKEYELRPFLRTLFLDPEFYAEDVIGTRIAGPVEYLVGACRRLGLEPPGRLVWIAAGQLGQRLFEPPSVKGWDRGRAWISTSTFIQRGNAVGLLLGVVSLDEVLAPDPALRSGIRMDSMESTDPDGSMEPASGDGVAMGPDDGMDDSFALNKKVQGRDLNGMKRLLSSDHYWPRINLGARCREAGATHDAAIVEFLCGELLAVEATAPSRAALSSFLEAQRAELDVSDGALLSAGPDSERTLRKLAHLVLSLPEANLN